jgi:hypothetical protein
LHRRRRDLRQHEGKGIVRSRLNSTINVGEGVALIGGTGRTLAFCEPAVADPALLANAGFVLEKQADALAWMCICNFCQLFRGSF